MKQRKIITLTSGLGNQMFQYALFLFLKQNGSKCRVYPFNKYLNQHNGLELERLFSTKVSISKTNILIDKYVNLYFKLSPYLSKLAQILHFKDSRILFKLLPYDVVVFPGWKDYTFIPLLSEKIQSVFKFPEITDSQNLKIITEINNTTSVSIHIRRGDFQSNAKWRCTLGDICDRQYYQNAIDHILTKYPTCTFFIFSDDITWAKKNLSLSNARFIDWNHGENSYKDLYLMSLCKHNILSNSTFSLWGAWLNKNSEKTVIVPLKWHNEHNDTTYRMYTDPKWIFIDNRKPNVSLILDEVCSPTDLKRILNQRYSDFEIITDTVFPDINDDRIKTMSNPTGNFIIHISNPEIKSFKNRNYLKSRLLECFEQTF